MFDAPKTLEQARAYHYGQWAGSPNGNRYDVKRCAYEVPSGYLSKQCSKAPGHGPEELYCKSHAKKVK